MVRARKGDLVAFSIRHSVIYADGHRVEWVEWKIGEVAHASRVGEVRSIRTTDSVALTKAADVEERLIVEASRLARPVDEILDLAARGVRLKWTDPAEVRAFVRPFLKGA